jgi:hypothetical protein
MFLAKGPEDGRRWQRLPKSAFCTTAFGRGDWFPPPEYQGIPAIFIDQQVPLECGLFMSMGCGQPHSVAGGCFPDVRFAAILRQHDSMNLPADSIQGKRNLHPPYRKDRAAIDGRVFRLGSLAGAGF